MPISRYEVRNEYSLADPELYRAADKDDPEALLEGVAMAGLVGVLRQLGDLAEFAAEIFHNLHEEVMVTAARGHGLMVRVQQLESEIPSIERAFLSQIDHSSFFYHAGVDWHPNLRLDQNLITQGDLPRFIMDSYEECRAPPRLFLLDKFDVAGAGACLKRYTDPSFFKVENSDIIGADVQREKKIRKIKKKGPRLRNGETTEVLQTTHNKLHQLFLEERVENGASKPSFRAKLKRRLNGFPFDSKTEKSYMEKILKSPSPDHKVLHDVTMNSPHVMTATDDHKESSYQVFEVRPVSPDRASWGIKRSPPSSLDGEENMPNPFMCEPAKYFVDDNPSEVPNSYPSIATNGISSSLSTTTGVKVVAVDVEGDREGSLTGYLSDDIASEIDNFVDAPSNMDLEMDGDLEFRVKGDVTSSHIEHESLILDADEEHLHTRSSDSPGGSTMSDEGNTSSTKELSSFSSNSPSNSLENPQSENTAAKGFQYDDVPVTEMVDASSHQKIADEDFHVDHQSKLSDDTCTEADEITNHRSQFELLNSSLYSNGSVPDLMHSDSEEVGTKGMLKVPESDETVTTLDDEEKKAYMVTDSPRSPRLCGESRSENESPGSSAREHLVDEQNGESLPSPSTLPDTNGHTADSSGKTSLDSMHEDEFDGKDQDLVDDVASKIKKPEVLWTSGTPETISSRHLIPVSEDEFSEVPENTPSFNLLTAHYGDNIEPAASEQDNVICVLDDEDSIGSTDSPVPCIIEASLDKKLDEAYLATAQTVDVEDSQFYSSTHNQIGIENLEISNLAVSPDRQTKVLEAQEGNVISEEVTTTNETLTLETPEHCDVVGLPGTTDNVVLNNSEALGDSCCTPEDLEEPAGTADTVDVAEIPGSADLMSVSGVDELLDKSYSEADKSNTTNTASAMPADSDNVSLNNLVEEQSNNFEDSGKDELEDNENCPSEYQGESDVDLTEASASGSETVFSKAGNNDHPESEVSGTIPNSHLVLEADHSPEFVHAAKIEFPVKEYGVDSEQELFNQSDLENHAPDGLSLPVDNNSENTIAQQKIGLPANQADQDLLHPGEISLELPPSSPINHQQLLDHDDCKQDNDPPSFSELPRSSNHEIDAPGYSKDSFSSISPPINPFSEINQINPSDLPPLPPLPPVEWRMGKFQLTSSSTEEEMTRHKDLFPELISPQTLPSDHTSSPPLPTATDTLPISSTNAINSSQEEIKHSSVEISPETASKEENSCSGLEASTSDETTSLPPKIENKQEQSVMPNSGSVSTSPSKENVENSCSTLEAITLHDTTCLPPNIKDKQEQSVMPISESVSTSPAKEDGSRTMKLPRPRNPLIDDVAILDKSKLRKVSERVRPEIPKVDERDSLLEQIRTKSFNLKPAMASRPSIRGPNTNLNVAAILEKANAIRQAFAGSDEDDNDSWSE